MANVTDNFSGEIYLSRDNIRTQIINNLKYYLELENITLVKGSFLSYLVNVISSLTCNMLFYQSSVYKEFFMTTAQLDESVLNLSAFLGYNTIEAKYATAYLLMKIPFGFTKDSGNATITLDDGFKFYADTIQFVTYYVTTIEVVNNLYATVTLTEGNRVYNIPVTIDSTSADKPFFSFVLPVRQYKETEQEFQIDDDIKDYQFITLDVPISGQVSTMEVRVRAPGSSTWNTYTEFNTLYLMTSEDYGYVSRRTSEGRKLYFGNNLIGIRPEAGSTVIVTTTETEGAKGNVIAGTITKGMTVYLTLLSGQTQIVNYTVTNAIQASGGADQESIQEVRQNAIDYITSLSRLVSEDDYKSTDVVIPDSPLSAHCLAVLKRSDVRCNEIQLYSPLLFDGETVPTRNGMLTISQTTNYVPRGTTITIDDINYYTLFDITVDNILNKTAYYNYVLYDVEIVPTIISTTTNEVDDPYPLYATTLKSYSSGDEGHFELYYNCTESDKTLCTATMYILETEKTYSMTNTTDNYFEYIFDPYTTFPTGNVNIWYTIFNPSGVEIAKYSIKINFRQDLTNIMLSNISLSDSTSNVMTIYDIPCIKASYYDSVNKKEFELLVLQQMLTSMDFTSYRMITDFTNIKFTNTTGIMRNMLRNTATKMAVIDIDLTSIPSNPSSGDRYIIAGNEGGEWTGKRGQIAECVSDSTGVVIWEYTTPIIDDIVYILNKDKKYIYSEVGWFCPEYQIPLQLEVEIIKTDDYDGSDMELAEYIKQELVTAFSSRFGSNISIYRSEIVDVLQGIDGVDHCRVVKPESSIFFDFSLDDFTEQELLEYGPEMIYFDEDSISVRVY